MAIPITIPRLGWNMEEGTFVGWLKPDGAAIRAGEALFTLESEKATEDIECLDAGTLRIPPDGPKAGARLPVGAVIGYLVAAGETAPVGESPSSPIQKAGKAREIQASPGSHPPRVTTSFARDGEAAAAGPSVRKLARERGIDLAAVAGTGRGGRITAEDVLALDKPRPAPKERTISPRARRLAGQLGVDWSHVSGSGRSGRIRERDIRSAVPREKPAPTGGVRRIIAERMVASHQTTAPVTLTTTLDAANLVNLRNQFKAVANDLVPSYSDFLAKLSAFALQKHPQLNACWMDDAITASAGIHIGIAVDTDAGLLVPVVRDVPSLGMKALAARSRDLIERARARRLSAEEMHGGTFTITNLGAFGIETFTPIINQPQCAILGVGRIQRQPVVVGEQIVARDRLFLSLTFDHRIVDGAPAARFLQTLTSLIENPGPALMS